MCELAFLIGSGIEIVERVDIPEELIPADAKVEPALVPTNGYDFTNNVNGDAYVFLPATAGFAAARSAFDGDASKPGSSRRVRTDAPAAVFAEVVEQVGSCSLQS